MVERKTDWKEFPAMMTQIIEGKVQPPNLEPITNDEAVYFVATFSTPMTRGRFKDASGYGSWAAYFCDTGQNGFTSGEGIVLYYSAGVGKAAKFAICKHNKTEEGHRPNHMRGWHPGHCTKCGLDMSVDSGD